MARIALRHALFAVLLSLGGVLFASPVAFADPEPEVSDPEPEVSTPSPYDRMLGVELIGGFHTSYGLLGANVRLSPIEYLTFDAGAGVSIDGVRVAGGIAGVFPQDHFAFTFRLGAAGGPLSWETGGLQGERRYWSFTAFIDASMGLEYRWDEGITGRFFIGVEDDVIDRADACSTPDGGACDPALGSHPTRLYAGLAIGYMFDIRR
jgi:hypothetical protein